MTKENLENLLLDPEMVSPEVRSHVAGCPECSRELAELQATMAVLDAWEAPEPSPFFDARMAAKLRAEREATPAGFFERMRARLTFGSNLGFRPIAAGAFALLILIGGGTYAGLVNLNAPTPAAVHPSAAIQDLQSLDDNAQVFQQLNALDQQDDDTSSAPVNSQL
ncbi:anti-sigma factor family protein [Silvibacterium acidisoli]|uniref:anti-sigma factor family protein n=1 Tax=Acidobacteriaceae bacterium ZG23-2 TaxID=2883246 RepID=UPI00406D40D7